MDKRPLAGKLALVTGGSSGIGAACVRLLAAEGARVVIGYNQGLARAEALMAELPGQGHGVLRFSLEDADSHVACAEQIEKMAGRADMLVNSAGFTRRIPHADLEALQPALFNSFLTANVGGTYAITRAMLPLLQASGDGLVVNVSSVSAFTGSGSNMAYCAAKAGLDTLTMSMARAFGPQVRFLCVSPASVDTDFVEGRSRSELSKKALQLPLGRVVTPEDVALAVVACATHLKTATGSRIVIDGGHHL